MITEDYCSFELAKLLKEKGFIEMCYMYYKPDKHGYARCGERFENHNYVKGEISCPTHQMAMKWLREVHHIVMSISPTCGMLGQFNGYLIIIDKIVDGVIDNQDEFGLDTLSYKEAVEAAIKYSLENLI